MSETFGLCVTFATRLFSKLLQACSLRCLSNLMAGRDFSFYDHVDRQYAYLFFYTDSCARPDCLSFIARIAIT